MAGLFAEQRNNLFVQYFEEISFKAQRNAKKKIKDLNNKNSYSDKS